MKKLCVFISGRNSSMASLLFELFHLPRIENWIRLLMRVSEKGFDYSGVDVHENIRKYTNTISNVVRKDTNVSCLCEKLSFVG